MTSIVIFIVSGLAVVVLLSAKKLGKERIKSFFILNAISKGDVYARDFYHKAIHLYSEGKQRISFLFKRQIPIHSKNSFNKLISFIKEKRERYVNNMRDTRLLKKSDGISEFIKNMSDIERGNGEINDIYEDTRQNDSVGLS